MQAAADYWSAKALTGYAPNWYSLCATEIVRRITGQTLTPATCWLMEKFVPAIPARSMLEIGCLSGAKLRSFYDNGWISRGVGVDVAAGAIEEGRKCKRAAISLRVMDLNRPTPMNERFQVIHANGVLHHIQNLEQCSEWMLEHLTPDGVLIASEFTGPERYRYTREEIDVINEGVAMLPVELRETFDPASLQPKLDADPSESIRSRDIPDVLRAAGFDVELRPYGGNVLMRALSRKFFSGFDPRSERHADALYRIVRFDEQVMRTSPSHHQSIVARHFDIRRAAM